METEKYNPVVSKYVYEMYMNQNPIADLFDWMLYNELALHKELDEKKDLLLSQLQEWVFPSDFAYKYFTRYYKQHSNSLASVASWQNISELQSLLVNIEEYKKYVNPVVIDIGCWDWKKSIPFMNELKNDKSKTKSKYIWLDFSLDMLRSCDFSYVKYWNSDSYDAEFYQLDVFWDKFWDVISDHPEKRTYLMFWWTPCNFPQSELNLFLSKLESQMRNWDSLIINFYTYWNHKSEAYQWTLREKQYRFFEQEKRHYELHDLYTREKLATISRREEDLPGIKIWLDDFDVDFFIDESSNRLKDRYTFKKDIMYAFDKSMPYFKDVLFEKWKVLISPWILLDENFFNKDVELWYDDYIWEMYNTNESREFTFSLFKRLWFNDNELLYEVVKIDDSPSREIKITCRNEQRILYEDKTYIFKKWHEFHVTQTNRYKHNEIEEILELRKNLEVMNSFPVNVEHAYMPTEYETMRSYVVVKK